MINPVQLWRIPRTSRINLLNELFPYKDKLSAELLGVLEFGHYAKLAPNVLDKTDELNLKNIRKDAFPALVKLLKTNKTLKSLKIDEEFHLGFLQLLTKEEEDGYWQAPWFQKFYEKVFENIEDPEDIFRIMISFKNARDEKYRKLPWFQKTWQEMVMNPTEWIQLSLRENTEKFLLDLVSATQVDTLSFAVDMPYEIYLLAKVLETTLSHNPNFNSLILNLSEGDKAIYNWIKDFLTFPPLPERLKVLTIKGYNLSNEAVQQIGNALKNNTVLEKLICEDVSLLKIVNNLLANEEKEFQKAPWFREVWDKIIEDPSDTIIKGFERELN